MKFIDKQRSRWQASGSLLCVGLDPDMARLPAQFSGRTDGIELFCKAIVDATAELACAFKPQIAYFASAGAETQLEAVIAYIKEQYPSMPVVLDAKRGDIGATAAQYAREAFDRYGADSVTVNPYMGGDTISPYLEWPDRGVFVLCRTSNPGGDDLQQLTVVSGNAGPPQTVYARVADLAVNHWNGSQQIGLVVGATYPSELQAVRRQVGDMPLLVPGVGAQGADIQATLDAGLDSQGTGMLINSSRAILYASDGVDFAQAAHKAAKATRDAINAARARVE